MRLKNLLILLVLTVSAAGGCGRENATKTPATASSVQTEWTAQQQEILSEEKLPLNYNSLTEQQKNLLQQADEMLSYLNDTYAPYDLSFCYSGFHPADVLDNAWLEAYPKNGSETDVVMVQRKNGTLSNNYPDVAVRAYYEAAVRAFFEARMPADAVRVFASDPASHGMTEAEAAALTEEKFLQRGDAGATVCVYLAASTCTQEQFTEWVTEYYAFLQQHQLTGAQMLYGLKNEEAIAQMTAQDHASYRSGNIAYQSVGTIKQDHTVVGGEIATG